MARTRGRAKAKISEAKATMSKLKRKKLKREKSDSPMVGRKPKLVKKSEYQVEYILHAEVARGRRMKLKDRHWQYKVKWVGYPDSDNTWETESSFKGDIVEDFWRDVEQSDEDAVRDAREHHIGKRYAPSAQWIKRQKQEAAQAAKASA